MTTKTTEPDFVVIDPMYDFIFDDAARTDSPNPEGAVDAETLTQAVPLEQREMVAPEWVVNQAEGGQAPAKNTPGSELAAEAGGPLDATEAGKQQDDGHRSDDSEHGVSDKDLTEDNSEHGDNIGPQPEVEPEQGATAEKKEQPRATGLPKLPFLRGGKKKSSSPDMDDDYQTLLAEMDDEKKQEKDKLLPELFAPRNEPSANSMNVAVGAAAASVALRQGANPTNPNMAPGARHHDHGTARASGLSATGVSVAGPGATARVAQPAARSDAKHLDHRNHSVAGGPRAETHKHAPPSTPPLRYKRHDAPASKVQPHPTAKPGPVAATRRAENPHSAETRNERDLRHAIADHMNKGGFANEAKQADAIARMVSQKVDEGYGHAGASLHLHKTGDALATLEPAEKAAGKGTLRTSMETLAYVRDNGMPRNAVQSLREGQGERSAGASDLQVIEKAGVEQTKMIEQRFRAPAQRPDQAEANPAPLERAGREAPDAFTSRGKTGDRSTGTPERAAERVAESKGPARAVEAAASHEIRTASRDTGMER
ncbi:hypothetical protein F6X40_35530 [Paraburkholderia sp. UCT31]|uniref:hypothetical protein n=1 Tax=Paraburkholderia sp. UCT31 TaxID=2615209 RepID=UPI001654EA15|nr:hypothetical protein [Paraburkholderia sp. UCT31]MBC8741862.1 hypothetical protein [Paraburkholderia sp. UCT31]